MFSNVGVFGVQSKCLVEWEKIACMSRTIISEVESYELGCFYRTKTCFVAFIVDPSRVKLPLTRTTQGIYACLAYQKIKGARCTYRKVLNFYRRNRTSGGGFLFLRQA